MKYLILLLGIMAIALFVPAPTDAGDSINITITAQPWSGECPTNFVITITDEDTIHLSWTPGVGNVSATVIRAKYDSWPANATDGYAVYDGAGNATDWLYPTLKQIRIRAWSRLNDGNYTFCYASGMIGGEGVNMVGIALFSGLAALLMIGGVVLKNSPILMLSFLFWVGAGAFSWYQSETWMDIYSIMAIIAFMGAFLQPVLMVLTRDRKDEDAERPGPEWAERPSPSFSDWQKSRGLQDRRRRRDIVI